jgi:hypothetical protein
VAAWGLTREDLKAVVGTVKRSPSYRVICAELQARCPRDVWIDDGIGFVHFDGGGRDGRPAWFVFAVELESLEIAAAKRLEPDDKGHEILITDVDPEPAPQSTKPQRVAATIASARPATPMRA